MSSTPAESRGAFLSSDRENGTDLAGPWTETARMMSWCGAVGLIGYQVAGDCSRKHRYGEHVQYRIRNVGPSGLVHSCAVWQPAGYQTHDRMSRTQYHRTFELVFGGFVG